jgi:DNA-binding CsgD family transcriptional regulator
MSRTSGAFQVRDNPHKRPGSTVAGGSTHDQGPPLLSPTQIFQPPAAAELLERDRELARIEAAIAGARDGTGATVIVEGPAGIGKSAILSAARAAAEERDPTRVLRARGAELERDFAFGVVRQLFEPALREASASARAELLQGPAGLAARVLGLPGAPAEGEAPAAAPDASFAVLHGLYWLCANLAADGALVLAVDDAHWADTSSLRFLAFLLARLEELPVALIVATRPEIEGEAAHMLAILAADGDAHVVRPAPLSPVAVGWLVESGLGARPDRAFVEACHRATGGSPFLVRELVEALRVEGVAPRADAAARVEAAGARGARRWILLRMGRLPEPAAKLARALAVLESAELATAAALAGLEPASAAVAADTLVAAGMLAPGSPLSFVHPLVRAGIYEELAGAERSLAHRRAAELLDGNPMNEERVAEHLLATQPAADPWIARRLVEAARSAARRGAPESAAVLLRRTLAEPAPPAERAQVLLELGIAEVTAGQAVGEEHLEEALAHAGDDDGVRVGATLVLAHVLGRDERASRAVEIVDGTAALLRGRDERVAEHLEALSLSAGMIDAGTAPALADRLDAMRLRAEDPDAPREVLAVAALRAVETNEPAEVGIEFARRAFAAGLRPVPAPTDLPWFVQAAIALVWADALDEAQDRLDAGVAEARATGDSALFACSMAWRAWLLLRRGDLQAAIGDARTVLDAADLPAPQLYRTVATAILVNANLDRGDVDAAEAALERFAEGEPGRTQSSATLLLARGRIHVARRHLEAGLADMLEAARVALGTGAVAPGYLQWRSEAAQVHAALGDRDAAVALVREELALARAFGAQRTLGVALRGAGVVIGGPEGEQLLHEAVATLDRAGVGLERARALVELGALLRRANRRKEARELLREGLDIAHHAGARPVADRAATELRATGAKPRRAPLTGIESLTASERRVAELAAQGLTNREIAQALFVTARTVEGHLTRTFQKLDLRSRDDIAGALVS